MEMFIDSDLKLDVLLKTLKLDLATDQHNELVYQLYKHIEYTRRASYKRGYDQGKFDERLKTLTSQTPTRDWFDINDN